MMIKKCNQLIQYAYGTSQDLISDKEETKCNNIIKPYKNWLTFWPIWIFGQLNLSCFQTGFIIFKFTFSFYVTLFVPFDHVIKEETKEHNPNWPKTPDHQYRILIVEGSVSGKTNLLFNLILIKFTYMLKIHMNQNTNF